MNDTTAAMDIDRVRRETPGCERVIHLHNSGSSLMPEPVYRAMLRHLEREYLGGGYEAAAAAGEEIEAFYGNCAAMLGCDPGEIAFMENATAAWNAVFYGFARTLGRDDVILTATAEYASNFIACLQVAQWTGCTVRVVPDDAYGQVDCEALESMIDDRVRLISITHVPTNGGLVNPAAEVGAIARRHGVPFLLDACQSAGQVQLDVEAIGCDALSATGRKYLRGPRGTGLLYVRRESMDRLPPATLDLHGARWTSASSYRMEDGARRYENFENNVAGQIGLGVAIGYANELGLDNINRRIRTLADGLRDDLGNIPGVTVRDKGRERCGIVTFTHERVAPDAIRTRLAERGINIGSSNAWSTLLDMSGRGLDSVARCALHYFNTEAELATFLEQLEDVVRA